MVPILTELCAGHDRLVGNASHGRRKREGQINVRASTLILVEVCGGDGALELAFEVFAGDAHGDGLPTSCQNIQTRYAAL